MRAGLPACVVLSASKDRWVFCFFASSMCALVWAYVCGRAGATALGGAGRLRERNRASRFIVSCALLSVAPAALLISAHEKES
jgi:hypothetical protein